MLVNSYALRANNLILQNGISIHIVNKRMAGKRYFKSRFRKQIISSQLFKDFTYIFKWFYDVEISVLGTFLFIPIPSFYGSIK